jgi:hypothetical protein
MAHNTIVGLRERGLSDSWITEFLIKSLSLTPEEITQAFEGLDEPQA